tara:strand:- start:281 stop:715 length:435 start_codon:yes stop_codon:yes gene_type:complete
MTLELSIFMASVLFGVLLYWRESLGNKTYRIFNKLMNSKELQMGAVDRKGFVYQQSFLARTCFIAAFLLVLLLITQFLILISYAVISLFVFLIFGILFGTYIAEFVFKSSEIIKNKIAFLKEKFWKFIRETKSFIAHLQTKYFK